jgi:hypothetical protein
MARARTRTERVQVRGRTTNILKFLISRSTLRTAIRAGHHVESTVTNTVIRDEKGKAFEQISMGRFRCVESGEEFVLD